MSSNMSSNRGALYHTNDRILVFAGHLRGSKGFFKCLSGPSNARVLLDGQNGETTIPVRNLEKLIEVRLDDYQSLLSDLDEWRYQMRDMRLQVRAIAPEHDPLTEEEVNST